MSALDAVLLYLVACLGFVIGFVTSALFSKSDDEEEGQP